MPDTFKSEGERNAETTPSDSTMQPHSTHVPARGYPGEHAEGTTVKNPKTPETSEESAVSRVADKAAHKAAKREQEADAKNDIFTH